MDLLRQELTYRTYRWNRLMYPEVTPARWAAIFKGAAEMEKRFEKESGLSAQLFGGAQCETQEGGFHPQPGTDANQCSRSEHPGNPIRQQERGISLPVSSPYEPPRLKHPWKWDAIADRMDNCGECDAYCLGNCEGCEAPRCRQHLYDFSDTKLCGECYEQAASEIVGRA